MYISIPLLIKSTLSPSPYPRSSSRSKAPIFFVLFFEIFPLFIFHNRRGCSTSTSSAVSISVSISVSKSFSIPVSTSMSTPTSTPTSNFNSRFQLTIFNSGQVASVNRHTGPVTGLHFNPHKSSSYLLASGGADSEVFIISLDRPDAPDVFVPGPKPNTVRASNAQYTFK